MHLTTVALIFAYFNLDNYVASQLMSRNEGSVEEEPALGVDPKNSTIWGPGLAPHVIVLPARYFFVQLVGPNGQKANTSQQVREALKVRIDCNGDRQVWTQVLDRKDGSFIVRYKVFQSCLTEFRIIVTFQKKHVGKSPVKIQANVNPDSCYCPQYELSTWLQKSRCPSSHAQIENDLNPFTNVDFNKVLDTAIKKFYNPGAHSFCHYVVKNNEIYRKCYGEHVGFHIFPDAILLSLTRKAHLPDLEFIDLYSFVCKHARFAPFAHFRPFIPDTTYLSNNFLQRQGILALTLLNEYKSIMNLGDWPFVDTRRSDMPLIPIFSWCKTNYTADIVLPTYELMECSLEAMGRVSLDMMTVQANSELEWKNKTEKLFWRGRDSRRERLELVALGRKYPDLINASLTNFFFFRDEEKIYGPKVPHESFFKFFDYKYQLNIDGTVAAYRFPLLLAGDSVVFKVDSPYIEHFYTNLKPWRHYIPVQANLGDLVEKIMWAKEHDKEAKLIGEHGRKYAQDNLMPLDVICYHATVLQEWSKRLKFPVKVRSGMELVTQTGNARDICMCKPAPYSKPVLRDKREL